ncbi:hypothetical protein [Mucilaginibacter rubeus]|uniref:Uncharacterized protein n=1 Tax=Mucilaginibacter rubeus TaxID=2027860 RepID=A0A5C1I6W5_9SPHI|nr:hypothetical protein [Mucilaginibacter rubeus]QEM12591.1 hypothetical protein DEO27_022110 [Mucilaginibacter rubeus]
MTYIFEKLIPVLAVVTAWSLGFANLQSTYNRQDNIKRKRLLFNLMELRYWIEKELQLDQQLAEILELFIIELQKRLPLPEDELLGIKALMSGIIRKQFLIQPKLPDLETSIDNIVKELAEVDPVFAFELNGRFQVTDKIKSIQAYLEQVEVPEGEGPSNKEKLFDKILRPKLMTEVVKQLDEHILNIAGMISRKVLKKVKNAVYPSDTMLDRSEVHSFLNDYITKLIHQFRQPGNMS